MLTILLVLFTVSAVVFLIGALRQPNEFCITRTAKFDAPAAAIFPHINTLSNWDAWSPWAKLDPNAKNAFEGPESGIGAKMSWAGNNKVGVGSMTIINSRPDEYIQFKLDFEKPFKANNLSEFTLKTEDDETIVTWSMSGKNNFMAKAMGLFMNCDQMVGGQFEEGLENLQSLVES
jgi:hypothetical protein